MIAVRRSSPYFATISPNSVLTICRCRSGEARIASYSVICAISSLYSSVSCCRSRAASLRSCISRIARDWISSISSSSIRPCCAAAADALGPDQRDDLVDPVNRLDQRDQDVGALLRLAEQVPGAPDDDLDLMGDPVPDQLVKAERPGHAVD